MGPQPGVVKINGGCGEARKSEKRENTGRSVTWPPCERVPPRKSGETRGKPGRWAGGKSVTHHRRQKNPNARKGFEKKRGGKAKRGKSKTFLSPKRLSWMREKHLPRVRIQRRDEAKSIQPSIVWCRGRRVAVPLGEATRQKEGASRTVR